MHSLYLVHIERICWPLPVVLLSPEKYSASSSVHHLSAADGALTRGVIFLVEIIGSRQSDNFVHMCPHGTRVITVLTSRCSNYP